METRNEFGKKTSEGPEVEFKWALRLVREFGKICRSRKIALETPIIRISGAEKTFGSWDPKGRIISISRPLIENYPWDMVLEVLKHEMAHQYVSEVYREICAHGDLFRNACHRLGVHHAFTNPHTDLDQAISLLSAELPFEARSMLDKVEKLFALARSDNEQEARAASRKAREILQKYNLERMSCNYPSGPGVVSLSICHKKKRIESIQKDITSLLIRYYFVEGVLSSTYDPFDDTEYKTIVLIGRKENLTVAEYVYHFLYRTVSRLWQEYRKSSGAGRREKNSFDAGFIRGIWNNHTRSEDKVRNKSTGSGSRSVPVNTTNKLVEQLKQENQKEMDRLFPRIRVDTAGSYQPDSPAYQFGVEQGVSTHIKKGIHKKKSGVSGLLE